MRLKLLLTILFCCFFSVFSLHLQAQSNIVLQFQNGTEKQEAISSLQKLTFTETYLVLNFKNGNSASYLRTDLRKVVFASTTTGTQEIFVNDLTLAVYPNPATDFLALINAPKSSFRVNIYRLDGVLLKTQILNSGEEQIDISALAKGFYLLRVNNQTLKFTKL